MIWSRRQREILLLVGRDGLQYDTVARRLGIHVGTVRVHAEAVARKGRSKRPPREACIELYWRTVAPTLGNDEA